MEVAEKEVRQLQEWVKENQPADDLSYKNGFWEQIMFVRETVAEIFANDFEEYEKIQTDMKVISAHTSKSVRLPVFRVELADGTMFTMRYNFHDWKVSVDSPRDVVADFMGLFDPNESVHDVYCEGFPKGLVYGSYAKNKRQFTLELSSGNHHIFTFFWIFAHQVLGKK